MTLPLSSHRRIVVKIGSALLVDRETGLKREWLRSLCADVAALADAGVEMCVVSSGAIALGRTILGLGRRALKLEESQAAAAVGQIALAGAWWVRRRMKRAAGNEIKAPRARWSRKSPPARMNSSSAGPSRTARSWNR